MCTSDKPKSLSDLSEDSSSTAEDSSGEVDKLASSTEDFLTASSTDLKDLVEKRAADTGIYIALKEGKLHIRQCS